MQCYSYACNPVIGEIGQGFGHQRDVEDKDKETSWGGQVSMRGGVSFPGFMSNQIEIVWQQNPVVERKSMIVLQATLISSRSFV
jgi:hypothetical protein